MPSLGSKGKRASGELRFRVGYGETLTIDHRAVTTPAAIASRDDRDLVNESSLAAQPPNRPFSRPTPRLTAETTGSHILGS